MHLMVIGAGLSGVSTAWYLRQAGHEVSVVDRQPGPAQETSFANGGQISISHPEPWANPQAPGTVLRWLGRADAPLKFHLRPDPRQWRWGASFLRECLPGRTRANTQAIGQLARLSRDQLVELRESLALEYHAEQRGILHLFFDPREADEATLKAEQLGQLGIPAHPLDVAACVALEPALQHLASGLCGGLHGTDDESGNARLFTEELATRCHQAGVSFHFDTRVEGWRLRGGVPEGLDVRHADGQRETLAADAWVLCAGSFSPFLAASLGERLPIYPVKGYSITAPVLDAAKAPRISLTDEDRRIVCSRLGDQIRVAGTAELNGYARSESPARGRSVRDWLARNFPGAGDLEKAVYWSGFRPTTPSNRPIIGASRIPRVWYNTGHGTLGWTLACGSAHLLAQLVQGESPQLARAFQP